MKIVSLEHFERMQMMSQAFERESNNYSEVWPEFQASKAINNLIESLANPNASDFQEIETILTSVDNVAHRNGSQWYDYKIHVMATLRVNGYNMNL